MTREEVISIFPISFYITEDIIKTGKTNLLDPSRCIGALSLEQALIQEGMNPEECTWGDEAGSIYDFNPPIRIGTAKNISMMDLENPIQVIFILK